MISIIGGVLLILGAFLFYRGNIYYGSICYLIADFVWVYNAYRVDDLIGVVFISAGFVLGIGVFLKMHYGIFRKTLNKGVNNV